MYVGRVKLKVPRTIAEVIVSYIFSIRLVNRVNLNDWGESCLEGGGRGGGKCHWEYLKE